MFKLQSLILFFILFALINTQLNCPDNSSEAANKKSCVCNEGYFAPLEGTFRCKKIPVLRRNCLNDAAICICPDNAYTPDNSQCLCNDNYYSSQDYPLICTKCPPNSFSKKGVDCQCNQGYFAAQEEPLQCCPLNSYFDGKQCVCNEGFTMNASGDQCDFEGNLRSCSDQDPFAYNVTPDECACLDGFVIQSQDPIVCVPQDPTVVPKSGCHPSCLCKSSETECARDRECVRCRQSEGTQMVNKDFCQCLTPEWRLKEGSDWECERVPVSVDVPKCEWQLFNQINYMVVHSNCNLQIDSNNKNYVVDVLSFDWRRLNVALDEECKQQLRSQILWSKNCADYVPLDLTYVTVNGPNQITIKIPLIDVYNITTQTQLSTDGRTIFQIICLAVELSNARVAIRQHRFQLRVYTNRDQVEVFHLTVDKQYTEGCDKGQECVIVANLDTKGNICNNDQCDSFKPTNSIPNYTIGNHMYIRIQFIDNTYTKYLSVVSVKFTDDNGIYTYVKNVQWWTLRQELGSVDIDILLFQPHHNATIEVHSKIALSKDPTLRNLVSKANDSSDDQVVNSFKANVLAQKVNNAQADDDKTNFGYKISFFCLVSLLYLLI